MGGSGSEVETECFLVRLALHDRRPAVRWTRLSLRVVFAHVACRADVRCEAPKADSGPTMPHVAAVDSMTVAIKRQALAAGRRLENIWNPCLGVLETRLTASVGELCPHRTSRFRSV